MRAPSSELPIEFDGVTMVAGGVTILDNISLSLHAGPPTVLIVIVIIINALAWGIRRAGERYAG